MVLHMRMIGLDGDYPREQLIRPWRKKILVLVLSELFEPRLNLKLKSNSNGFYACWHD